MVDLSVKNEFPSFFVRTVSAARSFLCFALLSFSGDRIRNIKSEHGFGVPELSLSRGQWRGFVPPESLVDH